MAIGGVCSKKMTLGIKQGNTAIYLVIIDEGIEIFCQVRFLGMNMLNTIKPLDSERENGGVVIALKEISLDQFHQ